MVPGLNTEVTHTGREHHVQTEDFGEKNPIILTLVCTGGAVVLREKLAYGELLGENPPASLIRALMEAQHRRIVRRVAAGEIPSDAVSPRAPGTAPGRDALEADRSSTPRPVDDLIEDYLRARRRTRGH